MFSKLSSGLPGTGLRAFGATAILVLLAPLSSAETVMTINGKAMDSAVLDTYIRSRIQKPVDQLTAEERTFLTDELADIYVLSTDAKATELEKDADVAAQLELQRMGILARAVAATLAQDIEVSEEEIVKIYDEQVKLAPRFQLKARHILVEKQSEAIGIIEKLIAGEDFQTLAKENSTDTSAAEGGDLGWFLPNQMVQPFAEALVRIQDGRYTTDPVQTQFGWHVIMREGTRPAEPPPLEGVRETIVAQAQQSKLREKIDELKSSAIE